MEPLTTNSADPDQLASDLDLHCLQRQDISGFSRTRVNISSGSLVNSNGQLNALVEVSLEMDLLPKQQFDLCRNCLLRHVF